jgi:hypothetical protein
MTDITHNNKYVKNVHLNVKLVIKYKIIVLDVIKLVYFHYCSKIKLFNYFHVKLNAQKAILPIKIIFANLVIFLINTSILQLFFYLKYNR